MQPDPVFGSPSQVCSGDLWEAAYARFETPQQEIRKFIKRLLPLGAAQWPRDAKIVELFCGRGNGLHALTRLGFVHLEGVDLSVALLSHYSGPAKVYVWDCRRLPFESGSRDVLIVQGGLHHLASLPKDLELTLSEVNRTLRDDGLFVAIEPWLTPFLSFVHRVCRRRVARRLFRKVDALATMIQYEKQTYEQWLRQPREILTLLDKYFHTNRCSVKWGKLIFVGRKKVRSLP